MVLVDTSVWIEHIRRGEPRLVALLEEEQVLMHPFIMGELACGNRKSRVATLREFGSLPEAKMASHAEVRGLVEAKGLWGRGIGWVDAHLLASALITGCEFWTADKRLGQVGQQAGVKGRVERPMVGF